MSDQFIAWYCTASLVVGIVTILTMLARFKGML